MESFVNSFAKILLPSSVYDRVAASSIAKRLARGSLWSLFGLATSRILVLISMILVARVLGQVSFGEFGLIQSTVGVAGLMAGMGLGATATRFVAQYATSDPVRAGRVIALIVSVSVGTVLLAAIVLISASDFIARELLDAAHLQSALVWGFVLMSVNAFRGIQSGVLSGLELFEMIAKLRVLQGIVSLVGMVILVNLMGVEGALLGLALGAAIVWIIGRFLMATELEARHIVVHYKGCGNDWPILSGYALPNLLGNVVALPVLWFAMLILARTAHGYGELGLYNAAYQWHGPIILIPMILMSVSIPVLVQEWEAGRRKRFRAVTLWMCGSVIALSLIPATLGALLSPWIMSLYGPGFRDGWVILVLLLAAAPMHALANITSAALLGMNRAWWVLGTKLAWAVTMLLLAVRLVPTMGAQGLAWAFLVAYGVHAIISFASVLFCSSSGSKRPGP